MYIRLESFYKCICYWFLEGCIWVHLIEVHFPVAKVFLKNFTIMKTCPTLSPASTFLFSLLFHVLFLQGCDELYTAAQGWSHLGQWPALKQSPSLLQGNSLKNISCFLNRKARSVLYRNKVIYYLGCVCQNCTVDPSEEIRKRVEELGQVFIKRFAQAVGQHCEGLGRKVLPNIFLITFIAIILLML